MPSVPQALQLLQASVDEDDESHFRFLCDGRWVKYVTVAAGLYEAEDMCFAPVFIPALPLFPTGDWNDGYIARNPQDGKPHFERTTKVQFAGVESVWHPTYIDHLELVFGEKLRSGVYEATCPRFPSTVVVKFARFEWEIYAVDCECAAYEWIAGQDIGPKFLGHLTEEGRVIGFVMEKICGARHAGPDDLTLCQEALSRLHQMSIVHGDVNKHNFLIRDGRAVLIDFDCARKEKNMSAFEDEMRSVLGQLEDTSGRGGSQLIQD